MRIALLAIASTALLEFAASASAQAPDAMVEDIKGSPPGVEMMDYVFAGKTFKLGAKDTIVLTYLKSCQRETITGATVTVGAEQSDVQGGVVNREKTPCDAGKMQLSVELASKSGAMVFRDVPKNAKPSLLSLRPQFTLYGLSPVVELKTGTAVVIERVDKPGERYELTPDGRKMRGALYDFADDNKALVRAGVYRATMGSVQVLFQVDPGAQPGRAPLAGRLLRLQASN
jgi:hypothetical protein